MRGELNHRELYRLPWNLADNPIAWLEPTQACNLACDGCYRKNVKEHDPLAKVQEDLDTFARLRNFDGVSIAGGDPLCHPEVVDIVGKVARMGRKPILNTNGLALDLDTLKALKKSGLVGITFHVDSRQGRPGWRDKTEEQMNELRSEFADMVASVGGLTTAFNSTVYEDTLEQVNSISQWGRRNIDIVQTVVFITFRHAALETMDYYAGEKKIDMGDLVYSSTEERRIDIKSNDVIAELRKVDPDLQPCAYLNGTEDPEALKWLMTLRVGTKERIHGYMGPKFMEAVQGLNHFTTGRYLAYSPEWTHHVGRSMLGVASLWDSGARRAGRRYLEAVRRNPLELLKKQHLQAVMVIQPIDILEDGRQSMCDGCPDMTVHDGKLAWSCRLEEVKAYGQFVTAVPRKEATEREAAE